MDQITEGLLETVRSELGYREKDGQYTKFGNWYAAKVGDPQYRNAPWCDMFLAWAAEQAGVQDYVGSYAWTPSHAVFFKQNGAWSATPEPGALVFFDWGGSKNYKKIDHVGIVETVEGGRIHTIEANVDRVWLKRKTRDESKVVGYGLPRKVKEARMAAARSEQAAAEQTITLREADDRAAPGMTLGFPMSPEGIVLLVVLVMSVALVTAAHIRRRPLVHAPGRHRRRRDASSLD